MLEITKMYQANRKIFLPTSPLDKHCIKFCCPKPKLKF